MKIAFFELEGWEEPIIKKALPEDEIILKNDKITGDHLPEEKDYEVISTFVNSPVDKAVIEALPNLKLIATRSTGFDHIDLDTCKEKGIRVVNVPGYGDPTVAEHAFSLILNLTRKTFQGIDRIKETGTFSFDGLRGIDLNEKTIGVIGAGRIGRSLIKMAKGFGMKVIAYDPFPNEEAAKELGFEYSSLEELLKSSDVISLHVPYNEKTHHLLNKDNMKLIKKGAYLINTARGGLIETDALVNALKDGILAGAGLDVLEEEGEIKDEVGFLTKGHPNSESLKTSLENHILMNMPNVLITPHNAFNTQEALERILNTTLEGIKGYKEGKEVNVVKK